MSQVERELPLPAQQMFLLDGEIKGADRLRQVGCLLFDGLAYEKVLASNGTASTGRTLRMLELPIEWSKQIDVKAFASVDTVAADDVAKQRFEQVIAMMRDPDRSTFAFVLYPESTPIIEAYRAGEELKTVGIEPGLVVANFIIPPAAASAPYAQARRSGRNRFQRSEPGSTGRRRAYWLCVRVSGERRAVGSRFLSGVRVTARGLRRQRSGDGRRHAPQQEHRVLVTSGRSAQPPSPGA